MDEEEHYLIEDQKNLEIQTLNSDIIVEILYRLPAESLLIFKTISKGWHKTITDNSFERVHYGRAKITISGFFIQDGVDSSKQVKYLSLNTTGAIVCPKVWDFLGDKIRLAASSNGLLCCHNPKYLSYNGRKIPDSFVYICNPATKECVQINRPKGSEHFEHFAIASTPLGNHMHDYSDFKLVCVSKECPLGFLFQIYSSKTKEWRKLDIYPSGNESGSLCGAKVVASGVLYWMTRGSGVIAFDVKTEQPSFIYFPVRMMQHIKDFHGECIGESEGRLHYILISMECLHVWFLDSNRKWAHNHSVRLSAMEKRYPHFLFKKAKDVADLVLGGAAMNSWIEPLAYKDGILLLKLCCSLSYQNNTCNKLYLYNIGSSKYLQEMCTFEKSSSCIGFITAVPYCITLAPLESAEVEL